MRPPVIRASTIQPEELVADNFAGGGGASDGIQRAAERPVDIAINHDPEAIAMHRANHPETRHWCEDIFSVDPVDACAGRPLGFAWFSPDCTHHSRAKGKKPRDSKRRALAEVVIVWAERVRPRIIFLENVEEFEDWGPLDENGYPIKTRAGEDFRAWVAKLIDLGYEVQWRSLVAADYGTPTTRRRLFLIARCDGLPIVWPAPTHGPGRAQPHRAAAEIIDWSMACPSIFLSRAEGRLAGVNRPLAPATLQRIATGIRRYVIEAAQPFIIPTTHQGDRRVHAIGEPVRTITAANRGELALVSPFLVRHGHYSTITGAGLREGCGAGTFRGQPLEQPLATVCATNDKHLVVPLITKHYGGVVGHGVERPIGTVTAVDHHALTAAFLTKYYGTSTGADVRAPLPTVTAGGGKGGGHIAEVRAFLVKYYGAGGRAQGQQLGLPLGTVTTRDRFGLVTIHGQDYEIADIGMRMLQPRELFAAQGFPSDYRIDPEYNGKPLTKTAQTRLAGNSVCSQVAEAIVAANTRGHAAVAA